MLIEIRSSDVFDVRLMSEAGPTSTVRTGSSLLTHGGLRERAILRVEQLANAQTPKLQQHIQ